jgi:hypothetical protein
VKSGNLSLREKDAIKSILGIDSKAISKELEEWVKSAPEALVNHKEFLGNEDKKSYDARRRCAEVFKGDYNTLADLLRTAFNLTDTPYSDIEVMLIVYNKINPWTNAEQLVEGESTETTLELADDASVDESKEIFDMAKENKDTNPGYEGFAVGVGVDVNGANPLENAGGDTTIDDAKKEQKKELAAVKEVNIATQTDLGAEVAAKLKENAATYAELQSTVQAAELLSISKPVSARLVSGQNDGISVGRWGQELGSLKTKLADMWNDFKEKTGYIKDYTIGDSFRAESGEEAKVLNMVEARQLMYPLLFNSPESRVSSDVNLERADAYKRGLQLLEAKGETAEYNIMTTNPRYTVKGAKLTGGSYEGKILDLSQMGNLCAKAGGRIFYVGFEAYVNQEDNTIDAKAPKFVITQTKKAKKVTGKAAARPVTTGKEPKIVTVSARLQGGKELTSVESNFEFAYVEDMADIKKKKFAMAVPQIDIDGNETGAFVSTMYKTVKKDNGKSKVVTTQVGNKKQAPLSSHKISLLGEFYGLTSECAADLKELGWTVKAESSVGVKYEGIGVDAILAELEEFSKDFAEGKKDPSKVSGALGNMIKLTLTAAGGGLSDTPDALAEIVNGAKASQDTKAKAKTKQAKKSVAD